ncbi:sporulation protein YkvU [Bacillus carboniphilus]|uniref:Sporulation protein YkvU n=1 Tax=Bacillus carboniphilus TaxID=86663 RepID=A0ABN0W792_9BACI
MRTFFKGTLLLIIAAFIGECIEFLVNMVLARELGEKGMGLYMSILPSIFLIVILASLELPIAISKFAAEQEERYHRSMLKHATSLTVLFTGALLIVAVLVLPYIPVFDDYHPMVRWIVVALIPIISLTSITRGYFMGTHAMGKIAFSNFLRKFVQLLLLVFIYRLLEFETNTSILVALCTIVVADLVVLGYLGVNYILQLKELNRRPISYLDKKIVRRNLLSVSVPTTGLRIFHSVSHAVQPFLIKAALVASGLSAGLATEHFGLLAGVALSIGFFPAFIAHSLLIVLIPTVSKAHADKNYAMLQSLLQKVMRFTALYGIPAVIVFYIFAEPLTQLFFKSNSAELYLQILWPYFLFHFFIIPMQAFLIGLGLVSDAFYHQIWSTIISFVLMYVLGSIQELQMEGVIIGMNTGAVLVALMHYLTICKKIGVTVLMREPVKRYS